MIGKGRKKIRPFFVQIKMYYLLIPAILIIGVSGIAAQVLVLRELLVSFYGNELTLGIILANWMILEALGALIIGRYSDRIKNRIGLFIALEIIFTLSLPFAIYSARVFKGVVGIASAEAVGLATIFYASFLINLILSFCHGGLFILACKIFSKGAGEGVYGVGKVYSLETAGTIAGGLVLTWFFIPYLNVFTTSFIICLVNLFISLFFLRYIESRRLKYTLFFFILSALILFLTIKPQWLEDYSLKKQYPQGEILDYRNSVYGNLVVTKQKEQYSFFYDGLPIITTPYPDITAVEEFANLPLLIHPSPCDVLIIGSGGGGVINEVLKHAVLKIDYIEIDPLVVEMLRKYPSILTKKELSDKRVKVKYTDGRFFVRTTPNRYDIVLVGPSKPTDLASNRLFTEEFFSLVKNILRPGGILAFRLSGSLTYLSPDLRDLNFSVLNALKKVYHFSRIIPGDYNLFLASPDMDVAAVGPGLITQRLAERSIKTQVVFPAYLDYRLDKSWLEWFRRSSQGATAMVNQDLRPVALFETLVLWNQQFSSFFASTPVKVRGFSRLKNIDLKMLAGFVSFVTFLFWVLLRRSRSLKKISVAYSIAATGFWGMFTNLALIFAFQVFYGYLYYKIGLLISIFMAGIALGGILMTLGMRRLKDGLRLFIGLEAVIVIFSLLLPAVLIKNRQLLEKMPIFFSILFFIPGFLLGLEFPLASKIYIAQNELGRTAGLLYACDLMGGWLAGILSGVLLLPILGLVNSCLLIAIIKAGSLILLVAARNRPVVWDRGL